MDKAKKKTIKRIVSWVALAALVATLAVMPLLARQEEEADGPVASILEATVQTGQISTVLKGGGTLSAGKAMEVNLPSGVKVKEFLVKNGEAVTEGTPVAIVDRVSVMNAIVAVEDTLEYLQKEIGKAKDDTVSGTIKANAGGLVKQVFARKGDSVQDVMLTYGALAVLSLDGRMAVALEQAEALAAGDSVSVTLADGTEVDGRVESNLNGRLIITIEDDKYEVGQKVTVDTAEGDRLGTGELYVHNAWRATAYSGTVNTVYAKENAEVYEGATLLTLKDTDFEGTMQKLANLHREYEELLQDLFVMYDTEILTAPCDGMVSGVDENSPHLLAAVMGEEGWFVDLLDHKTNGAEKGWTVVKLAENNGSDVAPPISQNNCTNLSTKDPECKATAHDENCYYRCTGLESCTAKPGEHGENCLSQCISSTVIGGCKNGAHKENCIDGCISSNGTEDCPSKVHKATCIESCVKSNGTTVCPATVHYTDCIGKCDKSEDCGSNVHYSTCLKLCKANDECNAQCHKSGCPYANLTYKGNAFWVWQVGTDGLIGRWDNGTTYTFTMGSSGIQLLYPTSLSTKTLIEEGKIEGTFTQYRPGDVILVWEARNDENEVKKSGMSVYTNIPVSGTGIFDPSQMLDELEKAMMAQMEGLMGGLNFGNFASYGMYAGAGQAAGPQLFDLKGSTLMTVTEQESMTLTIAIDEHDIAKVALGQIADVELTALKGETFQAEVTEIGNFGTNNGGSSKFNVELTMDADPRMLAGMNANAEIPLSTKMEVPVIPVAALVETVNGTVVYTGLDSKTGDLAAPVAVEIGASDGENVEIVSGVNKGDKIYYSYYDVLELDHTAKNEFSFR